MPKNLIDRVGDLKTYHTMEDGKNFISYEQDDVQPLMDFAHAIREETDVTRANPDAHVYCRLPNSVVEELRIKHGINILARLSPTDESRLWYLIETEYRAFKMTNKRMWLPT